MAAPFVDCIYINCICLGGHEFSRYVLEMTDISAFKNIKVPLWAIWIGRYRAKQRRKAAAKEWNHIATIFTWVYFTDTKRFGERWYILSESGTGVRKFEFGASVSYLKYENDSEYARIIAPWVLGRWSNQQMHDYAPQTVKRPVINDQTK